MKCFHRIIAFFVSFLILASLSGLSPPLWAPSGLQSGEEKEEAFISLEFFEYCIGFKRGFRFFYQGAPRCPGDFIAMYRMEGDELILYDKKPLMNKCSDLMTMILPSLPGEYELSLWAKDGAVELARSSRFHVIWPPSSLRVVLIPPDTEDKRKFLLEYCGYPLSENDRIALYRAGDDESDALAYKDFGSIPSGRVEWEFDVPSEPGYYEFRLLTGEGEILVNQSPSIHSVSGEMHPPPPLAQIPVITYPPLWMKAIAGHGKVYLEWTPPEATMPVTSYLLYRRTIAEEDYTLLKALDPSEANYLDEEVTDYTIYFYQLRLVDAEGQEQESSNEAFVIPQKIVFWVAMGPFNSTRMKTFSFVGSASPGSQVTVNHIEIPVLPEGHFLATVEMEPGKNQLEITATNKSGEKLTHPYWITLNPIEPLWPEGMVDIVLTIGSKQARVNGKTVELDVAPFIDQERTLVPFRFVGESLGAEVTFTTDSSGRVDMVSYTLESTHVVLFIGQTEALVNGKKYELEVPARIVQGRTVVPVRFVSEALGCEVFWNTATREVKIRYQAS